MAQCCEMCEREKDLTFHHLIPKQVHSKNWCKKMFTKLEMKTRGIMICRDCHSHLHVTHDHKTLAREYNTLEAILADPDIAKFIEWVSKQTKKAKK
jgi:hypothetical protein